MKMNKLEKMAMNNPVRSLIQRYMEAPLLERLGGKLKGLDVLEVGCGRGVGTQIILERFGAHKVSAIDLDEGMIKQARRRLKNFGSDRLKVNLGDVTSLNSANQEFDAVFNFAALHHVKEWQGAVAEIARVLKPGGRFFFQEVTAQWILRWPYRVLFEHPTENRFSGQEFISQLEKEGIEVGSNWVERGHGDFVFGVGCVR